MAVVSPRPLPDRPTVIVLRALPGLGDWLCAVPTFRALRAARPDARVHLVGLGSTRELVGRYRGLVDAFHDLPGWPGLPEQPVDARSVPAFLAALQREEADLAIQLHGSGEVTNELVELFGARDVAGSYRAGARCPDPGRFLTWDEAEPEVQRGLRLLSLLGILDTEDGHERLSFPLDPAERGAARDLIASSGVLRPYVVLHPGGRRPADRWPPAAFVRIGREVAAAGWGVVVTADRSESSLATDVAAAIPGAASLGGRTTLDTLGWVLREASLLISNDTGVSHLADALGVPSVVVFANDDGTRAARWAPLDRTLHHAVIGSAGDVSRLVRELLGRTPDRRMASPGAAA